MYTRYVTNTTSVQSQVISDIAALASGSPISALSASCDKVNTQIIANTVAAGWSLVDATAPQSGFVVTAPDAQGTTTKAVRFHAPTSATIAIMATEDWNATTKVGTNPTFASSNSLSYSATVQNTFVMFVTPRTIWLTQTSGVGVGIFEFTRDCAYLIGTNYPTFAVVSSVTLSSNTSTSSFMPRHKNPLAAGDLVGSSSIMYPATIGTKFVQYSGPSKSSVATFDAAGNPYFEIRPVWASIVPSAGLALILGRFHDLLEISSAAGNNFDTFSDGTFQYVIINMGPCAYAFKMV